MNIFRWQLIGEPGDPFGNPTLVALDCLRIFIIICGALTILLTIPALAMTWNPTQKFRLLCIALFSIYVSLTEVQRIGDYANWRLLLGSVCSVWAVSSMFAFIRFEGNPDGATWAAWLHRRNVRDREELE